MRPKIAVLAILILALAGATSLAWQQYQELVSLRARTIDGDERSALNATLADLRRRNRELEAQLAALRAGPLDAAASVASDEKGKSAEAKAAALLANLVAQDSSAASPESKRDAELELLGALADLPEFQKLIALEQRGKIDAKYAALFRNLHLNPAQQQQLESLLADKQSAYADAMIAAHDQGLTGKDARDMALAVARATQKDIDGSIKSMLGPQDFNKYQNYERTMPQRETVNQLTQRLSYTTTPLTPKQQDQLVQTLASGTRDQMVAARAAAQATGQKVVPPPTTVAPLPGALGNMGIGSASSAVITPTAVARAQRILTSQQLSALQQMQQEQVAQQTLSKLIRTGVGKAPAPAPTPPPAPVPAPKG